MHIEQHWTFVIINFIQDDSDQEDLYDDPDDF